MHARTNNTDNYYNIALEYGAKKGNAGVTYNELIFYLQDKQSIIADSTSFRKWFYKNFFCEDYNRTQLSKEKLTQIIFLQLTPGEEFDDKKCVITGAAHSKYLEYLEIKRALKKANITTYIVISIVALTIIIGTIKIIISFYE